MMESMKQSRKERLVVKQGDARVKYVEVVSVEEVTKCIWWRWLDLGRLKSQIKQEQH